MKGNPIRRWSPSLQTQGPTDLGEHLSVLGFGIRSPLLHWGLSIRKLISENAQATKCSDRFSPFVDIKTESLCITLKGYIYVLRRCIEPESGNLNQKLRSQKVHGTTSVSLGLGGARSLPGSRFSGLTQSTIVLTNCRNKCILSIDPEEACQTGFQAHGG